jgi:hypothetical protein
VSIFISPASKHLDEGCTEFGGIRSAGRRFFGDLEIKLRSLAGGRGVIGDDNYKKIVNPYSCDKCGKPKVQAYLVVDQSKTKHVAKFFDLYPEMENSQKLHGISVCNRCDKSYLIFKE